MRMTNILIGILMKLKNMEKNLTKLINEAWDTHMQNIYEAKISEDLHNRMIMREIKNCIFL